MIGFVASFSGFTQSCGGFLTGTSGWVASPDIDEDGFYGNNEHCLWIIETGIGKSVQIEFQYVDIEEELVCAYDFVTVSFQSGKSDTIRNQSICQ